jgi:hypothetical protein
LAPQTPDLQSSLAADAGTALEIRDGSSLADRLRDAVGVEIKLPTVALVTCPESAKQVGHACLQFVLFAVSADLRAVNEQGWQDFDLPIRSGIFPLDEIKLAR